MLHFLCLLDSFAGFGGGSACRFGMRLAIGHDSFTIISTDSANNVYEMSVGIDLRASHVIGSLFSCRCTYVMPTQ